MTGDVNTLIDIVLNGKQGKIKVGDKTYDGIMPHNQHLDDHAIASILTFIRARFGNRAPGVSAKQVEKIRAKEIK